MIQIALLGDSPIVVHYGLRRSVPDKLIVLHTKDESHYAYESEAKELKNEVISEYKIPVELLQVDPFDMDNVIKTILSAILKAKKADSTLSKDDFVINITGGTKLMVAAASTAAFLSGSKLYYVMDSAKYRGEQPVKELPLPKRSENDSKGNKSKTTAIILEKIKKLRKCTYQMLLEEVRKDTRLPKKQRIEYHLRKLRENELIKVTQGWETTKINKFTGKRKIDFKKKTIELTSTGQYYAEFPDLVGNIL
jgi:hypothetical protein